MDQVSYVPSDNVNASVGKEQITIKEENAAVNLEHQTPKGRTAERKGASPGDSYTLPTSSENENKEIQLFKTNAQKDAMTTTSREEVKSAHQQHSSEGLDVNDRIVALPSS